MLYTVLGAPATREQALDMWRWECARSGRHPLEVTMFGLAETPDGDTERKVLMNVAGIEITLIEECEHGHH